MKQKRSSTATAQPRGKTKNEDQDYRHGERIIYHNGKVLFKTHQKGRIRSGQINRALKKKYKIE
ncbi:MAG: hypothetical protein GQ574_27845 [Crocinitomix sp.]|nr:hypothetical protein [Crocinitomix sp.]